MIDPDDKKPTSNKPTLITVLLSTLAAFIGVQSDKNRRMDFQQSSILPFLLTGLVFAGAFIIGLILIASKLAP